MTPPAATPVRRGVTAACAALVGVLLLALTVAPLLSTGDGAALAGAVVTTLLLATVAHLAARGSVCLPRGATARPAHRTLGSDARRGQTTDPIHHPRRPRAPGQG